MIGAPDGIAAYDLFAGSHCGRCGRLKLSRLFAVGPTGCAECDEVITRHCCPARPAVAGFGDGDRWECPACRSVWVATPSTGPCGECGQPVTTRLWEVTVDRRADGPRREPGAYTPLRNRFWPALPDTREAEERDRREWLADVTQRLGLVVINDNGP